MAKFISVTTPTQSEARGLLDELNGIQTSTRARLLATGWQWLVIWCVTFLGAAMTGFVPALAPYEPTYWMFASPVALALTLVVSVRIDARSPVRQRSWPYWTVAAAITLATFLASLILPDEAVVVAVWVIFGFGFAAFAWLDRIMPAVLLLSGMAVIAGILGFMVDDTFALYPALAFAFSAALAGIAVGMRIQSRK